MNNIQTDLDNLVQSGKGILIGSRGLGVHTPASDTDIALLWSDLPESLQTSCVTDIRDYFNFLPMHNSGLIKLEGIDVLLFESPEDMQAIKQAKADLLQVPKYLLENKPTRVTLFEQALNHYGWATDVLTDRYPTDSKFEVEELDIDEIPFSISAHYDNDFY